jgi:hypothetical protein
VQSISVVWRVKGGEYRAYDLNIERVGEGEQGPNIRDGYRVTSRLTEYRGSHRAEAERIYNSPTEAGVAGAGVDKGVEQTNAVAGRQPADADLDSGSVLNQVIDRLSRLDFGPGGFFVIGVTGASRQ